MDTLDTHHTVLSTGISQTCSGYILALVCTHNYLSMQFLLHCAIFDPVFVGLVVVVKGKASEDMHYLRATSCCQIIHFHIVSMSLPHSSEELNIVAS